MSRPPAPVRGLKPAGTLSKSLSAASRSPVPLPKQVRFVTFDCYGTLIDWETGAYDAFQKEADRDGFTIDKATVADLFVQAQREIMSGSYELYAEVLRRTAGRGAPGRGWGPEAPPPRVPPPRGAR